MGGIAGSTARLEEGIIIIMSSSSSSSSREEEDISGMPLRGRQAEEGDGLLLLFVLLWRGTPKKEGTEGDRGAVAPMEKDRL